MVITGLRSPSSIAVDADGAKMYWTDGQDLKIQRANLDGSNIEDLVTGTDFLGELALLIGADLSSGPPSAPPSAGGAACATFADNILAIPSVAVGAQVFAVDMTLQSFEPISFTVTSLQELQSGSAGAACATFADNILAISSVAVGSQVFAVDMTIQSFEPISFTVTSLR